MSAQWSAWVIDESRSNQDFSQWHVYRARAAPNAKWEYETNRFSKQEYPSSQQIQLHLKTLSQAQPQERNAGNQGTSTSGSVNDGNEDEDEDDDEDDDEEEDEEADANANTGHITAQLQNLRFGPSSPIGQASSANPYAPSMTSSGNNPFRGPLPANYSQGYSAHSRNYLPGYPGPLPHRSTTPHPGYSPYNNYPASTYAGHFGGQQGGFNPSAGSGLPSFVDHAALQQHRNGSLAFPTGYGQAQSHGGPLQDPRSIRRSATAQPGVRKSTERSQSSQSPRNFKVMKPKDRRNFFKAGRVFKAFWTQTTPESNNPFGEVTRFVVLRPHKHHSICLAIHTYQNQGTTARYARARDHVIIYSGERQPDLVRGEDKIIERRPGIKVRLDPKGEDLKPASRLNLAKFYTIEHNIAIFPVGKISSRDVDNVRRYCSEVQGLLIPADTPSQSLADVNEEDEEEDDDEDDEDD